MEFPGWFESTGDGMALGPVKESGFKVQKKEMTLRRSIRGPEGGSSLGRKSPQMHGSNIKFVRRLLASSAVSLKAAKRQRVATFFIAGQTLIIKTWSCSKGSPLTQETAHGHGFAGKRWAECAWSHSRRGCASTSFLANSSKLI